MSRHQYSYVFLGLSITSSWGNGHATTYRSLLRELSARGHEVLFLERDLPFYRDSRDLRTDSHGQTELYGSLEELRDRFSEVVRNADLAVVGSYVPQGVKVLDFVLGEARGKTAFYDIDTPITIGKLREGRGEYIELAQIPRLDAYFSFTGGPMLHTLESRYGAKRARALFCSVDPVLYYPEHDASSWDLGYLGTYSEDRQPSLNLFLTEPARRLEAMRFIVAGAQYPAELEWPRNVDTIEHLPQPLHRTFYNRQRFTLNVTRRDMIGAGYSPSVRLFEAAACATPIVSDIWPGIETFFSPGKEILLARSAEDVVACLREVSETERLQIGQRARARVMAEHTAAHRAETLERYTDELLGADRAWQPSPRRMAATT